MNDILELTKLQSSSNVQLEMRAISIVPVLESALALVSASAAIKDPDLAYEIDAATDDVQLNSMHLLIYSPSPLGSGDAELVLLSVARLLRLVLALLLAPRERELHACVSCMKEIYYSNETSFKDAYFAVVRRSLGEGLAQRINNVGNTSTATRINTKYGIPGSTSARTRRSTACAAKEKLHTITSTRSCNETIVRTQGIAR